MNKKNSPLSGIKLPTEKKDNKKKYHQLKNKSLNKNRPTPRSYRISFHELDLLRDKAEEISQLVGGHIKITDTLILRSLIRLSDKIDNNDIFEEIKLIRMEI